MSASAMLLVKMEEAFPVPRLFTDEEQAAQRFLSDSLLEIVEVVEAAENARAKLRHTDIVGTETWNALEKSLDALEEKLS